MTPLLNFLRIPARRLAGYLFCASWAALPLQLLAQQPGSQRSLKEISRPYYAAAEFELSQDDRQPECSHRGAEPGCGFTCGCGHRERHHKQNELDADGGKETFPLFFRF